jgi:tetratricopeptide (TPR) repeat protein
MRDRAQLAEEHKVHAKKHEAAGRFDLSEKDLINVAYLYFEGGGGELAISAKFFMQAALVRIENEPNKKDERLRVTSYLSTAIVKLEHYQGLNKQQLLVEAYQLRAREQAIQGEYALAEEDYLKAAAIYLANSQLEKSAQLQIAAGKMWIDNAPTDKIQRWRIAMNHYSIAIQQLESKDCAVTLSKQLLLAEAHQLRAKEYELTANYKYAEEDYLKAAAIYLANSQLEKSAQLQIAAGKMWIDNTPTDKTQRWRIAMNHYSTAIQQLESPHCTVTLSKQLLLAEVYQLRAKEYELTANYKYAEEDHLKAAAIYLANSQLEKSAQLQILAGKMWIDNAPTDKIQRWRIAMNHYSIAIQQLESKDCAVTNSKQLLLAEVYQLRAKEYELTANYKYAEEDYLKAADIYEKNTQLENCAQLQILAGQMRIDNAPQDKTLRWRIAMNHFTNAIDKLQKSPTSLVQKYQLREVYKLRGQEYEINGNFELAQADYNAAANIFSYKKSKSNNGSCVAEFSVKDGASIIVSENASSNSSDKEFSVAYKSSAKQYYSYTVRESSSDQILKQHLSSVQSKGAGTTVMVSNSLMEKEMNKYTHILTAERRSLAAATLGVKIIADAHKAIANPAENGINLTIKDKTNKSQEKIYSNYSNSPANSTVKSVWDIVSTPVNVVIESTGLKSGTKFVVTSALNSAACVYHEVSHGANLNSALMTCGGEQIKEIAKDAFETAVSSSIIKAVGTFVTSNFAKSALKFGAGGFAGVLGDVIFSDGLNVGELDYPGYKKNTPLNASPVKPNFAAQKNPPTHNFHKVRTIQAKITIPIIRRTSKPTVKQQPAIKLVNPMAFFRNIIIGVKSKQEAQTQQIAAEKERQMMRDGYYKSPFDGQYYKNVTDQHGNPVTTDAGGRVVTDPNRSYGDGNAWSGRDVGGRSDRSGSGGIGVGGGGESRGYSGKGTR